jgi:hypothetical protein
MGITETARDAKLNILKCCFSLFSNDIRSYFLGNVTMEATYDTVNVTPYMELGGFLPFLICTPGD